MGIKQWWAQSALAHWWHQRITALILVPTSFWLVVFLHKALTAAYAETVAWLAAPFNALVMMVWLVLVCYHAALGVQVVLEDYVSNLPLRERAISVCNGFFIGLAGASLLALISIILF